MTVPTPIPTGSEHARWCGVPGCAAALLLDPALGEHDLSKTVALVTLHPDNPSQLVLYADQDSKLLDEVTIEGRFPQPMFISPRNISNFPIRAQDPLLPLSWVCQEGFYYLVHRTPATDGFSYRAAVIAPRVDPDSPYSGHAAAPFQWHAAYSPSLSSPRYTGSSPTPLNAQHDIAHQLLLPLTSQPPPTDPTPIDYNLLHRAALALRLLP